MSSLVSIAFTVFILILFVGIFLALFELPGTVIIFLDVFLYALLTGFDQVGGKFFLFLLFSSIIAETIDFLLVMSGVLRPVLSKKSVVASAIGAIVGILFLTPLFGGPGIWGGFFLGCLAGILAIEFSRQSKLKSPFKASKRAIFAMVSGKIVKGFIALFMVAISLSNIYS